MNFCRDCTMYILGIVFFLLVMNSVLIRSLPPFRFLCLFRFLFQISFLFVLLRYFIELFFYARSVPVFEFSFSFFFLHSILCTSITINRAISIYKIMLKHGPCVLYIYCLAHVVIFHILFTRLNGILTVISLFDM